MSEPDDHVDRDHVADLAERVSERLARGEDPETEFAIEWAGLTEEEKAYFMALSEQQIAHKTEKLEAVQENLRIEKAILVLMVKAGCPGDMSLGQALDRGYISLRELIETGQEVMAR